MICVVMQVAAMMPHHHHADSEAPCINFLHLSPDHADAVADNCCEGCSADGHDHDHSPFTSCNTHSLVITQPEREKIETEAAETTLPGECHCVLCTLIQEFRSTEYATARLETEYRTRPDVERPATQYVGRNSSPRAPDFTA